MTLKELKELLDTLNYKGKSLPVQYSHYKEGKVPALPYLIYYVSGSDDYIADNTNYIARQEIEFELYTKNTDFGLYEEIKQILNERMIVPSSVPFLYVNDQEFYLTRLSFTI